MNMWDYGVSRKPVKLFLVVDLVSKTDLSPLINGLMRFVNMVTISSKLRKLHLGVCSVQRQRSKGLQLQVLLKCKGHNLRDIHLALNKLSCSGADEPIDTPKLVLAVKSLIEHVKTQKWNSASKHVYMFAHGYQATPTLPEMLQAAADQDIFLHFITLESYRDPIVQSYSISGHPEAGYLNHSGHGTAREDANMDADPQRLGHTTSVPVALMFLTILAPYDTASHETLVSEPMAIEGLIRSWVSDLLLPQGPVYELHLTPPVTSVPHRPLLRCEEASPTVLDITPTISPCRLCPCHQQPVRSMLQGPPSMVFCSVTSQALPLPACALDTKTLRAGLEDQGLMRLSPGATAGYGPPVEYLPPSDPTAPDIMSRPRMILIAQRIVKMEDISACLVYGNAHCVGPLSQESSYVLDGDNCDVEKGQRRDQQVMQALCSLLISTQKVLVFSGYHDLDEPETTSAYLLHYVAQPALDQQSLLLRRIASYEQLLPPPKIPKPVEVPEDVMEEVIKQLDQLPRGPFKDVDGVSFSPLALSSKIHETLQALVKDSIKINVLPPSWAAQPPQPPAEAPGATGSLAVQAITPRGAPFMPTGPSAPEGPSTEPLVEMEPQRTLNGADSKSDRFPPPRRSEWQQQSRMGRPASKIRTVLSLRKLQKP